MGEKKGNSTLTVIVAIAVPLILFLVVKDIADSLSYLDNTELFAWVIYIAIVGIFEYFWLTRD